MTSDTSALLIRNAAALVTGLPGAAMRHDVAALGGDLRIRAGSIEAIGRLAPQAGERVIDASDCVVMPGWVNTHHHLFQSLLKGIPAGIDQPLPGWLAAVPDTFRRHFDQEALLRLAARVGLVELLLSGCTTVADHQYHYGPGLPFDVSAALFDEAARLGLRLVLCRGTQTRREDEVEAADTPPACRPETLDQFLASLEHDVRRFHDPAPRAMRRLVSAPTTPNWSVPKEHLKPIAREARRLGLRLHSHLSETADYVKWAREVHGCTPLEFVERHEWVGPDVWYAHMVHLSDAEIARCAETGTGTAHCPQSNARLGSGVAPVPRLLAAGAPVSLAVDGAASNEAADMLSEAHAAWLVHRAVGGAGAITAEQVIGIGTAGGGRMLGLDVGTLAPGAAADLAIYRLDRPGHFGLHDPAMAPVLTGAATRVQTVVVQGRVVVDGGAIPGLDLDELRRDAARAVRALQAAART
ncbi:amidohydrolase family protein [Caldimonas tepidiphila]|uniref:amidohydrolase family protein n=1 Tax=Caldimonas tepidiphila TaxID=2315841 RepID=UPI000E5B4D84|nr:amidohydrolase family protein [Caldimonas tepidiphila]